MTYAMGSARAAAGDAGIDRLAAGKEDELVGASAEEHEQSVAQQQDDQCPAALGLEEAADHGNRRLYLSWRRIAGMGLSQISTTCAVQPRCFATATFSATSSKKMIESDFAPVWR